MAKKPRDIERFPSVEHAVAKLRRLADALESDKPFRIQIAGERIRVPRQARLSIEHERGRQRARSSSSLSGRLHDTSPPSAVAWRTSGRRLTNHYPPRLSPVIRPLDSLRKTRDQFVRQRKTSEKCPWK